MSDRFSTDWAGFETARAKANRLNKDAVFGALSMAAITHVRVGFDGEGDQGQIEKAVAQRDGHVVAFPPVTLNIYRAELAGTELITREVNPQKAVEYLCYCYLEETSGGWELDEGSFGEFVFDVTARTITLEHFGRFVETAYSSHMF